ncbi:MAG TPA: hypothetical protein VGD84_21580 [Pseudonocardiaceae bacterium]
MNWSILGAALLIALIATAVLSLRRASRTLDAIMAEHHERMDDNAETTTTPRRRPAKHRLQGRRRMVRPGNGYATTHRRMSA